ncbi:hypothetical protein C7S16_2488 [Burkholderia thailandensis]|uniref:Uncharacterized protein n=1 Tax=Burkholderia thailandensis TaxID=57975 RepID=A0AAW9CUC5_BURTH|nr:hypothetical protein [Burkholderia thailandensis]MDW9254240.1 hypothetical protein [Burkholderia thailandensis]
MVARMAESTRPREAAKVAGVRDALRPGGGLPEVDAKRAGDAGRRSCGERRRSRRAAPRHGVPPLARRPPRVDMC